VGGQKVKLAVIAAAMLIISVVIGAATAAAAKKPSFEIEIVTCPDGTTPESGDPNDCQSSSQKLPPPKRKGTPNVDQPEPEVTDVDLGSGDQGTSTSGQTSLDLNLKARDSEGNLKSTDSQIPAPSVGKPDVTTTGGALGPVGGGSPFDFVSGDQALASFSVPPFLLPIYVSAGRAYDVPWNVLAAINQIETDFGRIEHQVSYAGAQGWMQFMPGTWAAYGVDASGDGIADPYNPVDAIYAAARYLSASGAPEDLRRAIFAYNHADWYVDEVLHNASIYGSLPGGLVTETGSLAFGRFPVRGPVTYGDDFREAQLRGDKPAGLRIHPSGRASAVATQNATVTRVLLSRELARAFRRDPGRVAAQIKAATGAAEQAATRSEPAPAAPEAEPSPGETAGGTAIGLPEWAGLDRLVGAAIDLAAATFSSDEAIAAQPAPVALSAASPETASAGKTDAAPAATSATGAGTDSGSRAVATGSRVVIKPGSDGLPKGYEVSKNGVGVELTDPVGNRYRYDGLSKLRPELRPGSELEGGDALGPLEAGKPVVFATTAAGGAPVDPRPLVDGYRLQEAADYFNAVEEIGGNPFLPDGDTLAAGVLDGDQAELSRRVLADPGIEIYDCGRSDIEQGIIDKRTLGALLYLRSAGMTLTVTSLRCGHGYYTAGGGVSAHSYGAAVDIAAFNGQPVFGNQGPGSLTAQAIQLLMQLEGEARPAQLISLMNFGGPSFAMGDHADHLHVGYSFETTLGLGRSGESVGSIQFGGGSAGGSGQGLDAPEEGAKARKDEQALSERLGKIDNPAVPEGVSPGAPRVSGGRVEGERRSDRKEAEHDHGPSLELAPSASGAEMRAIDIPSGSDDGYAAGVVDGTAQGWEERQAVILAQRDGVWKVVGPPVDSKGEVVNPKLTELAVNAAGDGYAVGKGGAVVQLRGAKPPLQIRSGTDADLRDVDVDGVIGYAVGVEGTVLRLTGARAARERAGDSHAALTAVTVDGPQPMAAGSAAAGRATLLARHGAGWREVPTEFGTPADASIEIEDVAASGGEVWLTGSFADSAGTPLVVPFAAQRGGGGWTTYCSTNPALSVVKELGESTPGPCDHSLPSSTAGASATAVAPAGDGVIVAAGASLVPLGGETLGPAATPEPIDDLAAVSHSRGAAIGAQGRLVQFGSGVAATSAAQPVELPIGNARPVLVASAGPERAIAFGAGRTAMLGGDTWTAGTPTGIAVRDAAWRGDSVWAVDELGLPVTPGNETWSGPGDDESDRKLRDQLADQVGGLPLTAPGSERPGDGLRAVAFTPEGSGYAVGGDQLGTYAGAIGWGYTNTLFADGASLNDVAAGSAGAVAVGDHGALLEPDGGHWRSRGEGMELTGGADLTAAGAADDGTLLAAGGGVILSRGPDADEWTALDLPPLGVDVRELTAVDGEGDEPVVFALVESGADLVLLRGGEGGWRPVAMPEGVALSDLAPVPGTTKLLLGGDRYGRAVAIEIDGGNTDAGQAPDGVGESDADGSGSRKGLKGDRK
jgi:hypothetical protein